MVIKYLKIFSKDKINLVLGIILEEFKRVETENEISNYYSYLIECLWLIFRERSHHLVEHLPTVINLVMQLISTTRKELKLMCIETCKAILSSIITNYPMVSFHEGSQKLAIGSIDGKIFIYDMNTGCIWKNLVAHNTQISALIFDKLGNLIISYSSEESMIKCWKIGLGNFFNNFLGKEYRIKKLPKINEHFEPNIILANTKFQLTNKDRKVLLVRENKSVFEYSI